MNKEIKMNLFQTISFVISGIVGSGILVLSKNLSNFNVWGILAWPLGAFCCFIIFKIFNRIFDENAKDLIDVIKNTFGKKISGLISFSYYIAMIANCAFVTNALAQYLNPLLVNFNINISSFWASIIILFILLIIDLIDFNAANNIISLFTTIKIVLFFLIGLLSFKYFGNYNFNFTNPINIINATPIVIFAFFGFEYAILYSKKIENSKTVVPLATNIALLISTIIYLLVHSFTIFVLKDNASLSGRPVYDALILIFGNKIGFFISCLGIISCITTLNSILLMQGSSLYNLSNSKDVPIIFSLKNKQGFAYIGSLLTIIGVIILNYFQVEVINYTTFLILIMYLICIIIDLKIYNLDINNFLSLIIVLTIMFIIFNSTGLALFYTIFSVYSLGYLLQKIS